MIVEHYSASPIIEPLSKGQDDEPGPKPRGLWVSVPGEDDWPSWCRAEDFRLGALSIRHEIVVHDDDILWLKSGWEVDKFHNEYGSWAREAWQSNYIHWAGVAKEYKGIIIAPYQWSRRLDGPASRWYYGWDCASGCIWDASAIVSISVREMANA